MSWLATESSLASVPSDVISQIEDVLDHFIGTLGTSVNLQALVSAVLAGLAGGAPGIIASVIANLATILPTVGVAERELVKLGLEMVEKVLARQ